MASLTIDERTGNYLLRFRWAGQQFTRSSDTKNADRAKALKLRVEEMIGLLKQGRLQMPNDADPGIWLMSDGKLLTKVQPFGVRPMQLAEICDAYIHDQHHKDERTIIGERLHIRHLLRELGRSKRLPTITLRTMQTYVHTRSRMTFHGEPISGVTIRKELVTFTQIWRWAKRRRIVHGLCPAYDDDGRWAITFAKPRDLEKFQTWDQIEKQIAHGTLSRNRQAKLWARLFLDNDQVTKVLDHVEKTARHAFIHPMFVFAAYTGARRSEISRSLIEDFNFATGQVKIREKKRKRSKSESYRFVDLHPRLRRIMHNWFRIHPGGPYTIAVPWTLPGRAKFCELTTWQAQHHFKVTLKDSKWNVLSGWHVLRHSFGANLARVGVPRDRIGAWMGHSTQEMMEHYQHLFPQDGASQIRRLR